MSALSFIPSFLRDAKAVVILDPVKDALENFSTSRIKAAPVNGAVKLDPHQVEPFRALFDEDVREVTNMACPQVGKSWPWQVAIGVKMLHGAYRGWIIYQDESVMKEVNEYVIQPLLESCPEIRRQMRKPNAVGKEKFEIEQSVLFYSSLINEPASHFVQEIYVSEVDRTKQILETRWKHYDACAPRVSRFNERKQSKICTESSPSTEDNVIYQKFLQGTQEYWSWRCIGCGEFNAAHLVAGEYKNGGFWGGLQWAKDDNGIIVPHSLRLHCFACNFPHVEEEDYKDINLAGEYIAKYPERREHRSFQEGSFAGAGAISGSSSRPWIMIAEAYQKMKRRKTYAAQLAFDNHFRGLPYQKRSKKELDTQINELLKHRGTFKGDPDDISIVLITADTQAKHWVYTVFLIDKHLNLWIHEADMCTTPGEMVELWNTKFYGINAEMFMIDRGGHRKDDVIGIIEECGAGVFGYLGNSRAKYYEDSTDDLDKELYPAGKNWAFAPDEEGLIFADPNPYRIELLFQLYEKTDPEEEEQFLFLPMSWSADSWQVEQITACKPPKGYEKSRVNYAKWNSGTHDHRVDDVFDCLKMGLVLYDVAKKEANWRHEIDFVKGSYEDK